MRFIHTSDWHLGRSFGPVSLRSDQEAFSDWFVDLVADQGAELVVIAGDLYDRAIAPVESIELFRDTVGRLLSAGVVVAAITGNHDGADRVAPYAALLDPSGLHLRGGYQDVGEVVTREFSDGPLDLVLLPFLDPQAAPDTFGADDATDTEADAAGAGDPGSALLERRRRRTHASVLGAATDLARDRLTSPRSVAIAHAYVTGATSSESERQLSVGGTGDVAVSTFEGFSYTALGHLHRPQVVDSDAVRYSGTPLAYSYSEDHDKVVVVVDIDVAGTAAAGVIPVEAGRRVQTIRGEMAELLDPNRFPDARDRFVRAVVTDRGTVLDARASLSKLYPHITEVQLLPEGRDPDMGAAPSDIREIAPIEATREFWEAAQGAQPSAREDAILVGAIDRALAGGGP